MGQEFRIYLRRSENELILSEIIFKLSTNHKNCKNLFRISEDETFFSSVITHSYYSIFYLSKAYLLKNNIKTKAPQEHKKTYDEFSKFVQNGKLDLELLKLYKSVFIKAQNLLEIFDTEKKKRGKYTYYTLPQANLQPSKESLENAKLFFKSLSNLFD